MTRKVVIIGGRIDGHGKVAVEVAKRCSDVELTGILDDDDSIGNVEGAARIGPTSAWNRYADGHAFHIAIGDNQIRRRIATEIAEGGGKLASLCDPASIIYESARIDAGTFIAPGAIIGPGVVVGANCLINHGAILEHDCQVADHVNLSTGFRTGGRVHIAEGVFAGVAAAVIPDVRIATWSYLAAGSVVLRNTEPRKLYTGVPAKVLRDLRADEAPGD